MMPDAFIACLRAVGRLSIYEHTGKRQPAGAAINYSGRSQGAGLVSVTRDPTTEREARGRFRTWTGGNKPQESIRSACWLRGGRCEREWHVLNKENKSAIIFSAGKKIHKVLQSLETYGSVQISRKLTVSLDSLGPIRGFPSPIQPRDCQVWTDDK